MNALVSCDDFVPKVGCWRVEEVPEKLKPIAALFYFVVTCAAPDFRICVFSGY